MSRRRIFKKLPTCLDSKLWSSHGYKQIFANQVKKGDAVSLMKSGHDYYAEFGKEPWPMTDPSWDPYFRKDGAKVVVATSAHQPMGKDGLVVPECRQWPYFTYEAPNNICFKCSIPMYLWFHAQGAICKSCHDVSLVVCECGGDKLKTTHSDWCPKHE